MASVTASLTRRLRLAARRPSSHLQLGYLAALVLATVITLLSAALLSTGEFAQVTTSLIIATIAPLVLAWGVPDAMTFRALHGAQAPQTFGAGLMTTGGLAAVAGLATTAYASTQGLGLDLAVLTGVSSVAAMLSMTCQGVELALDRMTRVSIMTVAPGVIALAIVCLAWGADSLSATTVVAARAIGSAAIAAVRAAMLRQHVSPPSGGEVWQVLRLGTPIHVSAVLAAGSLRLEQALIVNQFSTEALAAYGLVVPAVNGIRTLLYAMGTTRAVALAREANTRLMRCHRELVPLAAGGLLLAITATLALLVAARLTGHDQAMPIQAALLFVVGGTLSGLIDCLVRMYRGSGDARHGVLARVAAFVVTIVVGPWLIAAGVSPASYVGVLAGSAAYAVLLLSAVRNERA